MQHSYVTHRNPIIGLKNILRISLEKDCLTNSCQARCDRRSNAHKQTTQTYLSPRVTSATGVCAGARRQRGEGET